MTSFVPPVSGHCDSTLVLPTVDARLMAARTAFMTAVRTGATADHITACTTQYDECVREAATVYRVLGAVNEAGMAALGGVCIAMSEYTHRVLNDHDSALSLAVARIGQLESVLPRLCSAARLAPADILSATTATVDALVAFRACAFQIGRELANCAHNCAHPLADAWRLHAFPTAEKLAEHVPFSLPMSMRRRMVELTDYHPARFADSACAEAGWKHLATTPVGVRLGALARYGVPDHAGHLLLLEQLLLDQRVSLLTEPTHTRLRMALDTQPNASMPSDQRVPLLALLYAQCSRQPGSEQDLAAAVDAFSSEQLCDAVRRRVDQFDAGLCTRAEQRAGPLHHINGFFALAAVLFFIARRISADALPSAEASCALSPGRRQFCAIMRCLIEMSADERRMGMAAQLLFWVRYAERGDADADRFWNYSLRRGRLLHDVGAFVGTTGLWKGTSWTLNLSMLSE